MLDHHLSVLASLLIPRHYTHSGRYLDTYIFRRACLRFFVVWFVMVRLVRLVVVLSWLGGIVFLICLWVVGSVVRFFGVILGFGIGGVGFSGYLFGLLECVSVVSLEHWRALHCVLWGIGSLLCVCCCLWG